jgi:hypothetical protein
LCVPRCNGDIIDKAKAHRICHARMMPWGARGDKGVVCFAAKNMVNCRHCAARGAPDGSKRVGVHLRIGTEWSVTLRWRGLVEGV